MARGAYVIARDIPFQQAVMDKHSLAVEVPLRLRQQGRRRHRDVLVPVAIPVPALREVRLVGMGEGREQKERPAIRLSCEVVQPAYRPVQHRLIVIHLHAARAYT